MRIIPVIDLKNGIVVHGVAGHRNRYQPIVSQLTSSVAPLEVARAFAKTLGLRELYLADLDAIAGNEPSLALYDALGREGFQLWVDAGLSLPEDAHPLHGAGVARIVAGLETLAGPEALETLVQQLGDRLVFSLDLREGTPLTNRGWQGTDALAIAGQAHACGVRRLLVLDLARVGSGAGVGSEELCAQLVLRFPDVEVSAGGGVRGPEDLERLWQQGVEAVLVASALHDRRIVKEHCQKAG